MPAIDPGRSKSGTTPLGVPGWKQGHGDCERRYELARTGPSVRSVERVLDLARGDINVQAGLASWEQFDLHRCARPVPRVTTI